MSDSLHICCPDCGGINRVPSARVTSGPNCGKCKAALISGYPVNLTQNSFLRYVQKNDLPVVVDFWAPWCGPCGTMAPFFEQAATDMKSKALFAKLNTEQHQAIGAQYNIRSIPTLIVFKNGREVARQAGAMDATSLKKWVASVV